MARPGTAWLLPLSLLLGEGARRGGRGGGTARARGPAHLTPRPADAAAGLVRLKVSPPQVVARAGQDVRLSCEAAPALAAGCSWLRQRPGDGAWPPAFLLYTSGMRVQLATGLSDAKISGKKEGTCTFNLRHFSEDDQGHYFCLVIVNSQMHFSPLVPVFLPAQPTTKPAPLPTTQVPGGWRTRSPRPGPCRPAAPGAAEETGLDFACDIYIWAPLAGVCAALLLSLIITVICHHRNRRRVCKCPRPIVRQGGKPSPSGKYV
uniref:T-cell surface glycoprotein CD8 alpha chain n=1 Tax=Jaculus jaculus TaxID=51337 RepID=UPI001E1B40C8|nr:T-cell surface glycoprotein CD8 alpha chain [Jaculus jaculus]